MKKFTLIMLLFLLLAALGCNRQNNLSDNIISTPTPTPINKQPPKKTFIIERILSGYDQDRDGIDDLEDIVNGGRAEVQRKPAYKDGYYNGGYPPDNEGVCTDVIWRALKDAGYNLKELIDKDIKNNTNVYPRVHGRPEPNIDFRRVPNLDTFFKRYENLKLWQGGDIVVYGAPLWHIGIISDKRRSDGVPLLIHNSGPYAAENDMLLDWPSPIIHHFRFPKIEQ